MEKTEVKLKQIKKGTRGITLIALVVTIIVLLILAGISIQILTGENGILKRATDASEKTKLASEKEAIEFIMSDIKTGLMIGEEISKENYLGEKLSKTSTITGDWKNVIVGENTYKDGWYLLEKGEDITGYGEAKLNWLINYETGEVKELKDGEYTVASANASGAIVDETLKLNIDPVNLQDPTKWGSEISSHGGNVQEAVTKSELKFDGINDYLKIENVEINKSNGLTYEFYGKTYNSILLPLEKTYFDEDELSTDRLSSFRCSLGNTGFQCCFRIWRLWFEFTIWR